ncbi:MAG TPA: hypothetical protein VN605_10630 [Thermoanaerobaculia bacterium]|nr:hypothetical protein [Thermoanaerobaculia bacterium]
MIFLLLAITATFHPAQPTVGDPIAIEFRQPVALDLSPDYEIVSQRGNRVVVRTFQPKPIALSGRTEGVAFRNLVVPVRSVLKPKDDLQPAPLAPPRAEPYPRIANVMLGIAGALVALAWLAAWLVARRRRGAEDAAVVPQLPPLERYRAAVIALRDRPHAPKRWAALADATRAYLAATDSRLGAELTTTELLRREPAPLLAEILHQGDLEKFSPWGAAPADFAAIADRALAELAPEPRPESGADEEAA